MTQYKFLRCVTGSCLLVIMYIIFFEVLPCEGILDQNLFAETVRLRSDLLKNYDKTTRPVKDRTQLSTVGIYFDIHHVTSMDEKNQILTAKGQLMMFWTDEFLKWDPQSYSNIDRILFTADQVWKPDIYVEYNVKPLRIYEEKQSPPIAVLSNGSVEWFPLVQFDVPCSANYRHYPFDSHNCSVLLSAYGFNESGVLMTPKKPYWIDSKILQGAEWTVAKVSHEVEVWKSGRSTYQRVKINTLLNRVSRIYRYICVIPTITSMVTLLLGFWLLPSETSRYMIGCGNILVLSMLLHHLAATIPAGRHIPLLAQYSASCLSMSTIFVIVTVFINLLRECNGTAPNGLVRLAHFRMDRYLCIFAFSHVSSEEKQIFSNSIQCNAESTIILPSPDERKRRKDWYTVSVLADRIAFLCFAFIFLVLLSVLASV